MWQSTMKRVNDMLERVFKLKENGTSVKTEMVAGLTTFMTMAYILAVNPSILSAAGMDATAVLLATCFASGCILTSIFDYIHFLMYVVFALVGLAWASINVNSLPMVVEMSRGSEIGKYTGLYYTFSMSAQVVTPILAGALMNNIGYKTLFPYAAFFVACSFVTMLFVKHGDNKVEAKKGLDAYDVED